MLQADIFEIKALEICFYCCFFVSPLKFFFGLLNEVPTHSTYCPPSIVTIILYKKIANFKKNLNGHSSALGFVVVKHVHISIFVTLCNG